MPLQPNFTIPTAQRDLSPRARDLNQRLAQAIDEFRRNYPDTTDADIRRALMAVGAARGGGGQRAGAVALAAGLLVAAVVGFFAASGTTPDLPLTFWIGGAVAVLAIIVAIKRLMRGS